MNSRVRTLIDLLDLTPHPEGGYFKEVFRSAGTVESPVNGARRNCLTDIYFLLGSGQVSRFHRVVHDEIWHFYEGDPLELVEISPDLTRVEKIVLNGAAGVPCYKHCVKSGNWQAASTTGEYSLVGCTVAPGFDFADFEFLEHNAAVQTALLGKYPDLYRLM